MEKLPNPPTLTREVSKQQVEPNFDNKPVTKKEFMKRINEQKAGCEALYEKLWKEMAIVEGLHKQTGELDRSLELLRNAILNVKSNLDDAKDYENQVKDQKDDDIIEVDEEEGSSDEEDDEVEEEKPKLQSIKE